ncbi:hypothetical protein AX16_001447 [Volvariella volvacea WC 439]|nr:hypothetical protein AX16_001447 [Volvariella volvacea WC 439]
MSSVVGTLSVEHLVDSNGSFTADVSVKVPPAKLAPTITVSYHSAANNVSPLGIGWAVKGVSLIERVPATVAQDNFRGSINYDANDRFACNGQRLIKISDNEYRYEIEQWSKFITTGSNPANPDRWTEYLPDGTVRQYGATSDSNVKAAGQTTLTRVWAVSELSDPFSNYITYNYDQISPNDLGAFYIQKISYGGNRALNMDHQRFLDFKYEDRPDPSSHYVGGYVVRTSKRLSSIAVSISPSPVHTYTLSYDTAPLTNLTRLNSITLGDADRSTVTPLNFDWSNANDSVFNPVVSSIDINDPTDYQLLPIDVNSTGRSDVVIACNQWDDTLKAEGLYLYVALSDVNGNYQLSPHSGLTGLLAPTQLLALDVDGDGKTDLLHIYAMEGSYFQLTALLSTPDGYKVQPSTKFQPESMEGYFITGDFEGNGLVGLVYTYEVFENNSPALRFYQLVSDQSTFKPRSPSPIHGTPNVSLSDVQLVAGDFNGDGAEDVFIVIPGPEGSTSCEVQLLKSVYGAGLQYFNQNILDNGGYSVPWKSTTFFSHSLDDDGKTGLLALSENNGHLEYQVLRSTNQNLVCQSNTVPTGIPYNGAASLARTTSTHALDLVNVFYADGATEPQITVLRFTNDAFVSVKRLQLPDYLVGSNFSLADRRGIGMTDGLFTSSDSSEGKLKLRLLPCAVTKPVDFMVGYQNGLGAKFAVDYAPLTDPNVYTASDQQSSNTKSALNASSRNVTATATLGSDSTTRDTGAGRGRSVLVHFPKYVVKSISSCALPTTAPDVLQVETYNYTNARLSYDGRGWLGFEKMVKSSSPTNTVVTSTYYQQFPLIGQTSEVQTTDNLGVPLLDNTFSWVGVSVNSGKNCYLALPSKKETHYEGGSLMFQANVAQEYDQFGNITKLATTIPQANQRTLTLSKTYSNDTSRWVIGNVTSEVIDPGDGSLQQTKFEFVSGSQKISKISKWIAGSSWSIRDIDYDKAGNEITLDGPNQSKRTFAYDATYSFPVTISDVTASNGNLLTRTFQYNYAHGLPSLETDANGYLTTYQYDTLGRLVQRSEGDGTSQRVMESTSFSLSQGSVSCLQKSRTSWDKEEYASLTTRIDGLGRVWRKETPVPGDESLLVYIDTIYDGAGRIVRHSRNYLAGTTPQYTVTTYDSQSRPLSEAAPSANAGGRSVLTQFEYAYVDGISKVTQTRSVEDDPSFQTVQRQLQWVPDPEPSEDQHVKALLMSSVNPLNQDITTTFDGLARPMSVVDPQGVRVSVQWDGLSRQTQRTVTNKDTSIVSNFYMQYNDAKNEVIVKNEISSEVTTFQLDYVQRPVSKVTPDETFQFKYDEGASYSKTRLVSVESSKGVRQSFEYNPHGLVTRSELSIDGKAFVTSSEWSPAGQLLQTTNPDQSTITNTLLQNSNAIHQIQLADSSKVSRASITLDDFANPFSRPLKWTLGNNAVSTSVLAANGVPIQQTVQHSGQSIYNQTWDLDDYSKIMSYSLRYDNNLRGADQVYNYDVSGQLTRSQKVDPFSPNKGVIADQVFSYDSSGNISTKGDLTFTNESWKLVSSYKADGSLDTTFRYSDDGHLITKLDSSGNVKRQMTYDSDGRLISLDKTQFVYDYAGRLIKVTSETGSTTWYPSDSYELTVDSSGNSTHYSYINHNGRRASLNTSTNDSDVYYYHLDHLQSVVAVSGTDGSLVTRYEYDPYGKVSKVDGEDISRYKYSGKEQFDEFYYFGARFFDSETGRFTTLDNYPIDLQNLSPPNLNQYSFAKNDPINYFDVNGNVPWWHWFLDVGLIIGGITLEILSAGTLTLPAQMMIGAGVSGLIYDIQNQIAGTEATTLGWLKEVGIGAALGLLGFGVGKVVGKAATLVGEKLLPKVAPIFTKIFGSEPGIMSKAWTAMSTTNTGRIAMNFAKDLALGPLKGMGGQVAMNILHGDSWDQDLGKAAMWGAVTGAISGSSTAVGSIGKAMKLSNLSGKYSLNQAELANFGRRIEYGSSQVASQMREQISLVRFSPLNESWVQRPTQYMETHL